MLEKIRYLIGGIELLSCDEKFRGSGELTTMEIIKWDSTKSGKYTILAYWIKGKEGYDLTFVGNRLFTDCSSEVFWKLGRAGQDILDEYFDKENENE